MNSSDHYGCRGTIYDSFHDLEYLGHSFVPGFGYGLKAEMRDLGDRFELEAEMPAGCEDDVKIELNGSCLSVSARGDGSVPGTTSGRVVRSFNVSDIKSDAVSSSYTDGVLKVTLPKKAF